MRKKDAQRFINQVKRELFEYADSDITYKEMEEMERAIDDMRTSMVRVFKLLKLEDDH